MLEDIIKAVDGLSIDELRYLRESNICIQCVNHSNGSRSSNVP